MFNDKFIGNVILLVLVWLGTYFSIRIAGRIKNGHWHGAHWKREEGKNK